MVGYFHERCNRKRASRTLCDRNRSAIGRNDLPTSTSLTDFNIAIILATFHMSIVCWKVGLEGWIFYMLVRFQDYIPQMRCLSSGA